MGNKRGSVIDVDLMGRWRLYWGPGPLPVNARALGTVTRGDGDIGALIHMPLGEFVQGNMGALRSLPQAKVVALLGDGRS